MKNSIHSVCISDDDIVLAVNECLPEVRHLDMLSELELITIHMTIQKNTDQMGQMDVSLWWLRDRIIQLRKGGRLKSNRTPKSWADDMAKRLAK